MSADQPYPTGPSNPSPPPRLEVARDSGFFSALFDLTFTKFVTIGFAKFIYIIAIVAVVIQWLAFAYVTFSSDTTAGVLFLMFGWIPALLWLLFIRLFIEMAVAVIRTAINTGELVRYREMGR